MTTIERALVVLGVDAVRGIAAACLDLLVRRSADIATINRAALVRRSLATGIAAQALARAHHRLLAADAFLAGPLHNLGRPVQVLLDTEAVRWKGDALLVDPAQDIRELEAMRSLPGTAAVRGHHFRIVAAAGLADPGGRASPRTAGGR